MFVYIWNIGPEAIFVRDPEFLQWYTLTLKIEKVLGVPCSYDEFAFILAVFVCHLLWKRQVRILMRPNNFEHCNVLQYD